MAVKTTYICDRCHEVVTDTEGLYKMGVRAKPWRWDRGDDFDTMTAEWCETCVAKVGLIKRERVTPPATRITIEDLIQEIVGNAIENATGAR